MTKQTTKQCPNCGNTHLVEIRTHGKKYCTDCHTEIPWHLDPGQKPLLSPSTIDDTGINH